MGRRKKVINPVDVQAKNEKDKELLRQFQFWERCYKQRQFFLNDKELVASGLEALKIFPPLISIPTGASQKQVIELYNECQLQYDLSRTYSQETHIPIEMRPYMDILCEISRKYGYFSYDFLFMIEMDGLLKKVNHLTKEYNGKVPIEKVGWQPYKYADFNAQNINNILDNAIFNTYVKNNSDVQGVIDKTIQMKMTNMILNNLNVDVELESDFIETLKREFDPKIELYNYSRAIGLWIWDRKQKQPRDTLYQLIEKYKTFNYTFQYAMSENRVFTDAYDLAAESIAEGRVVPFSRKK